MKSTQQAETQLKTEFRTISINEIDQSRPRFRAKLDHQTSAEYARLRAEATTLPKPVVIERENRYFVLDGIHRIEAARMNGEASVDVELFLGEWRDGIQFGLTANATHGLPRSNADKIQCIKIALAEFPDLSDRELGRICAVDRKMVGRQRKRTTGAQPQLNDGQRRVGRDGKLRRMPRRGFSGKSTASSNRIVEGESNRCVGREKQETRLFDEKEGVQTQVKHPTEKSIAQVVDEILIRIEEINVSDRDSADGLKKVVDACTVKIRQIERQVTHEMVTGPVGETSQSNDENENKKRRKCKVRKRSTTKGKGR